MPLYFILNQITQKRYRPFGRYRYFYVFILSLCSGSCIYNIGAAEVCPVAVYAGTYCKAVVDAVYQSRNCVGSGVNRCNTVIIAVDVGIYHVSVGAVYCCPLEGNISVACCRTGDLRS